MLGRLPVYPILLSIYPVLSLLAHNLGEARLSDSYRSLLLTAVIGLAVYVLSRLIAGSWAQGGLLAASVLLIFFSYGHVYSTLEEVHVGLIQLGRHRYLIPFTIAVGAAFAWIALRQKKVAQGLVLPLNAISVVAVLLPLIQVGWALAPGVLGANRAQLPGEPSASAGVNGTEELPDIYYIVTDSYARGDVFEEHYDFDNGPFLQSLRNAGFYVAEESRANHVWTRLSLTATLNMDYFQNLGIEGGSELANWLAHSRVRGELARLGYSTVNLPSGFQETEWFDAEYILTPGMSSYTRLRNSRRVNQFEAILLEKTAALILLDLEALRTTSVAEFIAERLTDSRDIQRETTLAQFENLKAVPDLPGSKFVFVHIIPPHHPYIFGPNGEEVEGTRAFTLADEDPSMRPYLDQVRFVNGQLEEALTIILAESESPPIIILQSDHGPSHLIDSDWNEPSIEGVEARVAILNAYYLPAECQDMLYPSITPVNSFRIVFNCVLGQDMELLEDRSFYGREGEPQVPVDRLLQDLGE